MLLNLVLEKADGVSDPYHGFLSEGSAARPHLEVSVPEVHILKGLGDLEFFDQRDRVL